MNLYPITVIENFYENPNKVREFALSQKYTFCHERKNYDFVYPGGRTKDIIDLDSSLHEIICKKLISVFHNSEHDVMRWSLSTNFQSVTNQYQEGFVHTDSNTIFAGVLFLTPNAPLKSGTSLFKPNSSFDDYAYKAALTDHDQRFRKGDFSVDTKYHQMFDEIVRVNNVYNSLVIYEGDQFHAANSFFGDSLQDSRLTQVFFINNIDAQKYSVFPMKRIQNIKL